MSSRVADPAAPPKRAAWWTTLTGAGRPAVCGDPRHQRHHAGGHRSTATAGTDDRGRAGRLPRLHGHLGRRVVPAGRRARLPEHPAHRRRRRSPPEPVGLLPALPHGRPAAHVAHRPAVRLRRLDVGPAARVCGRRRHGPPACRADRGPRGPRGRRPVCRVPGGAGPAGRLHRVAGDAAAVRLPAGPLARAVAGRDRPGAAHRADATDRGAVGGGHARRRLAAVAPPGH